MKRALSFLFLFIVLLFGAVFIGASFVNWGAYKDRIVLLAREKAGVEISIEGDLGLTILPVPHVYVENASIKGASDADGDEPFLSFDRFDLYVSLLSLLNGQVDVQSVTLVRPVLNLVSSKDGRFNIPEFKTNKSDKETESAASEQSVPVQKDPFIFSDLSIGLVTVKDGAFRYIDQKTGQTQDVKNINVEISLDRLNGPYAMEGSLFYDRYSLNLDTVIKSVDFGNSVMTTDLNVEVHPLEAVLSFSGAVDFSKGLSTQGSFKAQIDDLAVAEKSFSKSPILKNNVPLSISGLMTYDTKSVKLDNLHAVLADTPLNVILQMPLSPFSVQAKIKTEKAINLGAVLDTSLPVKMVDVNTAFKTDMQTIDISDSTFVLDGQKVSVAGKYNLKTLKSEIYVSASTDDIKQTAKKFSVDVSSIPENVKKADAKIKISGVLNAPEVVANIDVSNLSLVAKGNLTQAMEVDQLVLQIKHPNTVAAFKQYAGISLTDSNLEKPLDVYMKVQQKGKKYNLTDVSGKVAGVDVSGALGFDLSGKVPFVNGNVALGSLKLGAVSKAGQPGSQAAASTGGAQKSPVQMSSRWSKEPVNVSALNALNADLKVSAKRIDYGVWPLLNPSIAIVLKDGVLDVQSLKAAVYDGNISFSSIIDASKAQSSGVTFKSQSKFTNADLEKISTSLIGTKLVQLSGKGDVNLILNTNGRSVYDFVNALSGQGTVAGTNIVLQGVDVVRFIRALSDESKPGDTVLGLWKGSTKGGQTQFDTLDGTFTLQNGVVILNKMDIDGTKAAIETRGNINLPQWTLATKHKLTAKERTDVPPFEVTFNGSLDNPAQTFGQGVLQDYLNRKIQRKFNELLSDKLGLPSNDNKQKQGTTQGDQTQNDQSTQEKAPEQQAPKDPLEGLAEDAIKNVLDGLLR